jgi:hypothetical protein
MFTRISRTKGMMAHGEAKHLKSFVVFNQKKIGTVSWKHCRFSTRTVKCRMGPFLSATVTNQHQWYYERNMLYSDHDCESAVCDVTLILDSIHLLQLPNSNGNKEDSCITTLFYFIDIPNGGTVWSRQQPTLRRRG